MSTAEEKQWLVRVHRELMALTGLIDRLTDALEHDRVPVDQIDILEAQLSAMRAYESILRLRVKNG